MPQWEEMAASQAHLPEDASRTRSSVQVVDAPTSPRAIADKDAAGAIATSRTPLLQGSAGAIADEDGAGAIADDDGLGENTSSSAGETRPLVPPREDFAAEEAESDTNDDAIPSA